MLYCFLGIVNHSGRICCLCFLCCSCATPLRGDARAGARGLRENARGRAVRSLRRSQTRGAWVTEFSGKAPYREMRGFAGREMRPQSGDFRHSKPAARILLLSHTHIHISFRCDVPTPSVFEVNQLLTILKRHILKNHVPELPTLGIGWRRRGSRSKLGSRSREPSQDIYIYIYIYIYTYV